MAAYYSFVVFVPVTHAPAVRDALARAGAGAFGNYDSCSFSSVGLGRFRPLAGAKPALGRVGSLELVPEERVETEVARERLPAVLAAVRAAHPYEAPGIHVAPLLDVAQLAAPPADALAALAARLAVVEETVRETLSGLAEDMAAWQASVQAQLDDAKLASAQVERSAAAAAAARSPVRGAAAAPPAAAPVLALLAPGSARAAPAPALAARPVGTPPKAVARALDAVVAVAAPGGEARPLSALLRRVNASESVLAEHEELLRVIIAERGALAAAAAGAAALRPPPDAAAAAASVAAVPPPPPAGSRPYSAPLKELSERLRGVEALIGGVHEALAEQTHVLEEHQVTLSVLQTSLSPARDAAQPLSPGPEGFV
jgi:hypothetical protein